MKSERPKWYDSPEMISVRVNPNDVKRSPLGNEISIFVRINDEKHTAVIPTDALNEKTWTVSAAKVGEVESHVLISFPSTSMGTATWPIAKSDIPGLILGNDS